MTPDHPAEAPDLDHSDLPAGIIIHGQHGAYELEELTRQPYQDCAFSSGFVKGHPVDTLYLRFERDGEEPTTWLLRPDEMAALAWCASGALWSDHLKKLEGVL